MRIWATFLSAWLGASSATPPAPLAAVAGRVAGAPEKCVRADVNRTLRTAAGDGHTLLFGSGRTIWVNHLGHCGFRDSDTLVVGPDDSFLCKGEVIRSFDAVSKIPGPACILNDFIPYKRP